MPSCLAYIWLMRNSISAHYARIGRRGGLASSPAKRAAARRNALKRWRGKPDPGILPLQVLRDGMWYLGHGRNSAAGLWDARAECFWTVTMNDFANPATFPAQPQRQIRLKREDYFSSKNGTFKPTTCLGA
jgi:hypothetical protein